ncbi:DUF4236 domain-containing protein [Salisediminibacterium beveridgei]|uniref:DUF4236 domain-containing protein n=1 Tax=Salisediminibacterium beveridgei TaxID=632773 RepID=A0A1D7QUK8_9BACI|nr:DUF4236 domain-containing protein [Salisediminibacterium beveridgei]AOM82706.1 hypothetical protein BBEV_1343 [Salisediminibacterium beveridgei]
MSFRFQRRIRVAPGIRVNLSKRGVSTSVGKRGGTVSVGTRGVYGNAGLPGTGLSYRSKLNKKRTSGTGGHRKTGSKKGPTHSQPVLTEWDEQDQDVRFTRSDGTPLSSEETTALKRAHKEEITEIYQTKADEVNERTARLLELHQDAYDIHADLDQRLIESFGDSPEEPSLQQYVQEREEELTQDFSWFDKLIHLLPSKKKELNQAVNADAQMAFIQEKTDHEEALRDRDEEIKFRKTLLASVRKGQADAMADWAGIFLDELDFPLETDVDYDVVDAQTVFVDVDLPNPDKVPVKEAEVLKSGKLKITEKTQRDQRDHYARLAGGTALYLASYFLAYLPTVERVIVSGYQQQLDERNGHDQDVYIYSAMITRDGFQELNLDQLHPLLALESFEHRMNATKTFILKEITPFSPTDS